MSKGYYQKIKERLQKQKKNEKNARERYQNISGEEKNKKQKYGRE